MLDRPCSEVECKSTGYPLHSPVSPSLPLLCITVCYQISTGLYLQLFHAISFIYSLKHLFTCTGTEIVSLITLKTVTHFLISCDRDTLSHHKHILMIRYVVVLEDEDLGKKCGICLPKYDTLWVCGECCFQFAVQ